jgi:hypothetical protein
MRDPQGTTPGPVRVKQLTYPSPQSATALVFSRPNEELRTKNEELISRLQVCFPSYTFDYPV